MKSLRVQFVLLLCCVLLGCTKKESTEKPRKLSTTRKASDEFREDIQTSKRDLAGGTASTPVQQGSLPLVYLVESAVKVRVVDSTAGATIATADASPRSIVSVSTKGVSVGGVDISSEPLSDKHKYIIFLDHGGENEIRQTNIRSSVKD